MLINIPEKSIHFSVNPFKLVHRLSIFFFFKILKNIFLSYIKSISGLKLLKSDIFTTHFWYMYTPMNTDGQIDIFKASSLTWHVRDFLFETGFLVGETFLYQVSSKTTVNKHTACETPTFGLLIFP